MNEWNWVELLSQLQQSGESAAICTVCGTDGSTPREVGAKMIVLADGSIRGTIGGGNLELHVIHDAKECLEKGTARKFTYPLGASVGQCCGGRVEVFIEYLSKRPELYVFGAGHVGQAVCDTLKGTPFRLHLIDDRESFALSQEVEPSVIRHHCDPESFIDEANWDQNLTYAVVMTHRHDLDERIVRQLMNRPARYIGLIGSHTKWARFQARYQARGVSSEKLARVTCPIGTRLLGKHPKAVAISLAAELLGLYHG